MHTGCRPLIRTPRTEDPGRAAPVGGRRFRPSVRLVTSGSAGTCWFDLACVRVEKRGDVVRCTESGCGGADGEIGWRNHEELPTGLSCADLMVAPAVGAPFGMVYLEAMACGTPPIATTTDGPARTIKATGIHATGWLVAPRRPRPHPGTTRARPCFPADRTPGQPRSPGTGQPALKRDGTCHTPARRACYLGAQVLASGVVVHTPSHTAHCPSSATMGLAGCRLFILHR
ncbi:glycosyltransferase [Streptomyces malaysiensis]|uniref:glycosyltransferase n=1 Tax=Streptomyces malaysiensis TaxID=92644 RepID=UPI0011CE9383